MTETATLATLVGRRILVAEDEYMIAEEVATVVAEAGAEVLGPVASIADALRLLAAEGRIEGALLARGVPVVLATGYDAGALPGAYAHLSRCEKPTSGRDLTRTLARMLAARCPAGG